MALHPHQQMNANADLPISPNRIGVLREQIMPDLDNHEPPLPSRMLQAECNLINADLKPDLRANPATRSSPLASPLNLSVPVALSTDSSRTSQFVDIDGCQSELAVDNGAEQTSNDSAPPCPLSGNVVSTV